MQKWRCATATPDQILPSHASMVHGLWEEPVEIFSSAGVCLSCLQALKIAYLSIAASEKQNAICSTSELVSAMLLSKNFDIEYERCCNLGTKPYMALEKDFLRFMLSDGASCALLENHPGEKGVSLKIECKRLLNYILCIRFFIEVHSIVSASRFFHMPTYLRVVIECQSRFFPFFPAFSRNCPDYFLHTSGSSSFRSLSDLGAR